MKYRIASKCIELTTDGSPAAQLLAEELRHYPACSEEADLSIELCSPAAPGEMRARNPGRYSELEGGFAIDFGNCEVAWFDDGPRPRVSWAFRGDRRDFLRKVGGIQFTHPYEDVGQVFHELVLVPSLILFASDVLSPVHGAALESPTGQGFVLGGCGGTGKTTLALHLARERGFSFLADDIALLDASGILHPNYAYPKIYGYNMAGDESLRESVIGRGGGLDSVAWRVRSLRGLSSVRRRVDPLWLFHGRLSPGCRLARMYILFRRSCADVRICDIDAETASEMNVEVIRGEYDVLFKNLHWQRFNRLYLGEPPALDADAIFQSWRAIQRGVLSHVPCRTIEIPADFDAPRVIREVAPALLRDLDGR